MAERLSLYYDKRESGMEISSGIFRDTKSEAAFPPDDLPTVMIYRRIQGFNGLYGDLGYYEDMEFDEGIGGSCCWQMR